MGRDGEGLCTGRYVSIPKGASPCLGAITGPMRARLIRCVQGSWAVAPIPTRKGGLLSRMMCGLAWMLSGVTIGRGAVVGVRAVVSCDVPPLAVVVGNPAQIVKYGFSVELADSILGSGHGKLACCASGDSAFAVRGNP